MSAFLYFFSNLALLNILLALVAFILGLLLGWLFFANRGSGGRAQHAPDHGGCESEIADLQAQLRACGSARDQLESELKATKGDLAGAQSELESAKLDLESSESVSDSSKADSGSLREQNMNYFSADLDSGKLRNDETYGLLYNEKPDEVDDLTRIKGVATVLNKTLNENGVYKYRQIALWSPQICQDFSEKIAFRGRVERDDWIGQCKQFHQEKYDEQI